MPAILMALPTHADASLSCPAIVRAYHLCMSFVHVVCACRLYMTFEVIYRSASRRCSRSATSAMAEGMVEAGVGERKQPISGFPCDSAAILPKTGAFACDGAGDWASRAGGYDGSNSQCRCCRSAAPPLPL